MPGEQFLERFGDEVAGSDCVATRANAISAAGVLTVSSPLELAENLVINRALITHQQELFLRFERDGDMHALVELGCRYLFRPADAPHREQVEQAMEPMGNMTVGASPWTLYRFK